MMRQNINIGDTVFISRPKHSKDFNEVNSAVEQFINTGKLPDIGVIRKVYQSEDRSYHGSPSYETIYIVQLQNGETATTDSDSYNRVCIFNIENLVWRLKEKFSTNINTINKLAEQNILIEARLKQLNTM